MMVYIYIANRICLGTKSTIVMYVLVKKKKKPTL